MSKNLQKRLRDKVMGQLLFVLSPFQVVALNIDDVAYDGDGLFLRVLNRGNNLEQYKFVSVSSQIQRDLESFLERGRLLYGKGSEALFPNRFGKRMSPRNIHMQYGRTSQELVEREIIRIDSPCGEKGIAWFNKWTWARVVYFMQRQDGIIKVGYSTACLAGRLQTLEAEYGQMRLLGLVEGDRWLEGKIKRWFRHLCVEGTEWFRPAPELLAFIQRVVKAGRDGLPF